MFEGIARIEATCYQEIKSRGGDMPTHVFSAGGGANNPIFTRIRAMAHQTELVKRKNLEFQRVIGCYSVDEFAVTF